MGGGACIASVWSYGCCDIMGKRLTSIVIHSWLCSQDNGVLVIMGSVTCDWKRDLIKVEWPAFIHKKRWALELDLMHLTFL